MAPEHASGGEVDRRSDIWSLGAVAYFMLAGRYPFDGPNDATRLIRILGTDHPEPLPDAVPPAVRDVIARALSKDADGRHASAAELAAALEASNVPATHDEVASFFAESLAGSMKARRSLVETALAAADQRMRARELLDGPVGAGGSMSYRPLPVALIDDDGRASGMGTLGTVTHARVPAGKPWIPWMTAALIGAIVIGAFALGSLTARTRASTTGAAAPVSATPPTSRGLAQDPEGATAALQAKALAAARAKAEAAEAPLAEPTAMPEGAGKSIEVAPAPSAGRRRFPTPGTTPPRKPTPTTSPAPTAKPPEKEDTIF